jgi:hypothetical protein
LTPLYNKLTAMLSYYQDFTSKTPDIGKQELIYKIGQKND